MIKVVLFDVGGTLLAPQPSVGHIYSEMAALHGIQVDAETLQKRFKLAWGSPRYRKKNITKAWWKNLVQDIFQPYTLKNFDLFFEDLYAAFNKKERWKELINVNDLMASLKNKGLHLGIASNWDDRLPGLLKSMNLNLHFSHIFYSHAIGAIKSNKRFFKAVLDKLGIPAEFVLHVGDDPEEDEAAAKRAGLKTYLVSSKNPLSYLHQFIEKLV